MAESPNEVIVAIGARSVVPDIPGVNRRCVVNVADVDRGTAGVGHKVVIVGGGISALECGIQLAHEGHEAPQLTRRPEEELWREVMDELRSGLVEIRDVNGMVTIDRAPVKSVGDGLVVYERDDEAYQIECDTVVIACGVCPDREEVERFREMMPDVTVVGDARKPGNIFTANMTAFDAAVEI